jgi:parallel beta-helix repeat protein
MSENCCIVLLLIAVSAAADNNRWFDKPDVVSVTEPIVYERLAQDSFAITPAGKPRHVLNGASPYAASCTCRAIANDIVADTKAIQLAVSYFYQGGSVYFPAGKYLIDTIWVAQTHLKLYGEGDLQNGVLAIGSRDKKPFSHIHCEIEGLRFFNTNILEKAPRHDRNLIIIQKASHISIHNCYFYGGDTAIEFLAALADSNRCERVSIADNVFECHNYAIASPFIIGSKTWESAGWGKFTAADVTISGNTFLGTWDYSKAKCHISIGLLDGAIITGNTFFPPDSACIRIFSGMKIRISNNNIFSDGAKNGIFLQRAREFTITDNQITGSQCAIAVRNWYYSNQGNFDTSTVMGIITCNAIQAPMVYGIELKNCPQMSVANNIITGCSPPAVTKAAIAWGDAIDPGFIAGKTRGLQIIDNITPGLFTVFYTPFDTMINCFRQNAGMGRGKKQEP